jgi:site-specific DNA recombinase
VGRSHRLQKFKLSGNPLNGAKPPKHLLSGLVLCGGCGGTYVSVGGDRWRCRERSTNGCQNASITGNMLSARVLTGIRSKLLRPDLIARFAAQLQQELRLLQKQGDTLSIDLERQLRDTQAASAKLVRQLESEEIIPKIILRRLAELEEREEELVQTLAANVAPSPVRLPANYERIYLSAIADLDRHLSSDQAPAARNAIRKLVDKVVVLPSNGRGGKERGLELHGDLFSMLDFAAAAAGSGGNAIEGQHDKSPRRVSDGGIGTSVVAGTGFEPVTFRL